MWTWAKSYTVCTEWADSGSTAVLLKPTSGSSQPPFSYSMGKSTTRVCSERWLSGPYTSMTSSRGTRRAKSKRRTLRAKRSCLCKHAYIKSTTERIGPDLKYSGSRRRRKRSKRRRRECLRMSQTLLKCSQLRAPLKPSPSRVAWDRHPLNLNNPGLTWTYLWKLMQMGCRWGQGVHKPAHTRHTPPSQLHSELHLGCPIYLTLTLSS